MQFNLVTPSGRAQAYAHSAELAAQVRLIEQLLEEQQQEIADEYTMLLDQPVCELYGAVQVCIDAAHDDTFDKAIKRFKKTIPTPRRIALNRLLRERKLADADVQPSLSIIQTATSNIQDIFKMS